MFPKKNSKRKLKIADTQKAILLDEMKKNLQKKNSNHMMIIISYKGSTIHTYSREHNASSLCVMNSIRT